MYAGQVWARKQVSRKSPGILVDNRLNMSQRCALGSPVEEKHLKPGVSPVKDHRASEGLEHRMVEEGLRLLGLLSLQKTCFRENLLLSTVTC